MIGQKVRISKFDGFNFQVKPGVVVVLHELEGDAIEAEGDFLRGGVFVGFGLVFNFEGEFVDLKVFDETLELLFLSEGNEALDLMLNDVKVLLIEVDLILLCRKEAKPALFIFLFQP